MVVLDNILEWLGFLVLAVVTVVVVIWLDRTGWEAWWKVALAYLVIGGIAWWRCDTDHTKEYWWKD